MSVVWLQWRKPTEDLRILVGLIEGVVETTDYLAAVGVSVADVNRLHSGSLGHDGQSKMLAEGRNKIAICRGIRELIKIL